MLKTYGTMLTMPTWTEHELSLVDPDIESWYDRFKTYGGVPRFVFWDKMDNYYLEKEIKNNGAAIAIKFIKYGCRWVDTETMDTLVHMNPPRNAEDRYMYSDSTLIYTFTSDIVFQMLCTNYRDDLLVEASILFNSGADMKWNYLDDTSIGLLFEKIYFWLAPVAGRSITCESLEISIDQVPLTVTLPNYKILTRNWKEEHNLQSDILYYPNVSNMDSRNAFCVVSITGVTVLIILQITIATIHPMKANDTSLVFSMHLRSPSENKLQDRY